MGQLLVMLIVPPIVGVVTYIVIRRIWERDENGASEAVIPAACYLLAGEDPQPDSRRHRFRSLLRQPVFGQW